MSAEQYASRAEVHPSPDDCCAECGDLLAHEWVGVIRHFNGIVLAGPARPPPDRPERTTRDFRYPDDLGVFFHPWCAPRAKFSEKVQNEIAELLANILVANRRKRAERWARIPDVAAIERASQRCQAQVSGIDGRRVFTMTRSAWERLRVSEGKLVEIDLERTPAGSIDEAASAIASLAAECSVHTERIEVWPYRAAERPRALTVQNYLVLENLTRRPNVAKFAERLATEDSPQLRKHLREHVFLVAEGRAPRSLPTTTRGTPRGRERSPARLAEDADSQLVQAVGRAERHC